MEHKALRFGNVTLPSGTVSPYIFNPGEILNGFGLSVWGKFMAEGLDADWGIGQDFNLVWSPTGGVPHLISTVIGINDLHAFRMTYSFGDEQGFHGDPQIYGSKVVLLFDQITDGKEIEEALKWMRPHGCKPVGVLVALDRRERVPNGHTQHASIIEMEVKTKVPVKCLVTFNDMIRFVREQLGPESPQYRSLVTHKANQGIDK